MAGGLSLAVVRWQKVVSRDGAVVAWPERAPGPPVLTTRSKVFPDRVSRRLGHHDDMNETVTVIAVVLSGLFAGLFATFSYAVMPGLRRTDDATFARAMREINVAILNPALGLVFGGSVLASIAAAILGFDDEAARWWLVSGAVLVFAAGAVTMGVNVPMNDRLLAGVDAGEPPASVREAFEAPWVRWNLVRTVLSTAGCAVLVVALVA